MRIRTMVTFSSTYSYDLSHVRTPVCLSVSMQVIRGIAGYSYMTIRQGGLAASSKCLLSHLGAARLIPGHGNLHKPLRDHAAPARLRMIDRTKPGIFSGVCNLLVGHFLAGLSAVSVRAESM